MKKFLFGYALAVLGLTMPQASASDYCCPSQCDPCCCESDFDGFYLGGNLGVFSHVARRNNLDTFLSNPAGWTSLDTDVTLGVQVGYDWLCCSKLVGLVVDWNWVNIDRKLRHGPHSLEPERNFIRAELDWFTTLRARAGFVVCDALFYITGGAAVAEFDTKWRNEPFSFHHCDTRWGWTGGVGAEFLVWCNWSFGAEVLFLHFANHEYKFRDGNGTPGSNIFAFDNNDSAWVGRFILNYRFGDICSWCCCR